MRVSVRRVVLMIGLLVLMGAALFGKSGWAKAAEESYPAGYTGLYRSQNGSYQYLKNGVFQQNYNGLYQHSITGKFYYLKNGVWASSYNGLYRHSITGRFYYLQKGVWASGYTGLYQHSITKQVYYLKNGLWQKEYTGLYEHSVNHYRYYIREGLWKKLTQLCLHTDGKYYYCENGLVKPSYTQLYKSSEGKYYYVVKGVWEKDFTGPYHSKDGYSYHVEKGKWSKKLNTTTADYQVKNGVIVNGFLEIEGKKVYVDSTGKAKSGVVERDKKLYYVDPDTGLHTASGWIEAGGKRYYAKSGGVLYRLEAFEVGSTLYAALESGEVIVPKKVVYLTFDDGPQTPTSRLLDILKKYNIKATFFVGGKYSSYNYNIGRAYREGHAIGNHTYSHDWDYIYANESNFWADIERTQQIIEAQTGTRTNLLRFPGGSSNTISRPINYGIMSRLTRSAIDKGWQYFDWNVSAGDAGETTSSYQVYKNIINGISANKISVVLCHDSKSYTVDAMEDVLRWIVNNGYTCLPLNDQAYPAHHGVNN